MDPEATSGYITVARITRPRGNRGEVLAEFHTDFPDRFEGLREIWLRFPDGRRERRPLEDSWEHGGRLVLKLVGVDSITDAEAYAGAWVEVAAEAAVELPVGSYYDHDLVGCRVVDPAGQDLGVVRDVVRLAGNHQLLVLREGHEYLIPARAEICREIAVDRKRIVADLPEGLMDLNK